MEVERKVNGVHNTLLWQRGVIMCRGTHLREGVAARNWFTTIDVSSAIAFPVEDHGRINKTMLIILTIPLLSVQSKPFTVNYEFYTLSFFIV